MRELLEKSGGLPSRRTLGALGWALLAAVAVLRLLTLAPDPWEWDELLFSAAARDGIDVRVNHPHPPGYPLFVLPARLLVLAGIEPFAATLGLAVVAGLAAVGLLALLARELGAGRKEALWAALLWAVVPAVWLHSVRPLSDSLGAAAFFLAALLLLRCEGAPSGGRLVAAAMAAGACAAVRPQVAVALLPLAAVAAWGTFRGPGGAVRVTFAAGAGLATVLAAYAPVVATSGGIDRYLASAREIARWVREFDTPPLSAMALASHWARWLVDPFGGPLPATLAWGAAAAGIVLVPRAARRLAIVFVPLLLLSVATLNPQTAPRYALPLLAAAPLAAGLGLTVLRVRAHLPAAAGATALLAFVALPAVPAIVEVARTPSPPVAAMAALRAAPDLLGRPLLVAPALYVHLAALGPAVKWQELERGRPVVAPPGALVVTHDSGSPDLRPLRIYRYESEALGRISRGRYLSVTIWESTAAPMRSRTFKWTDPELLSSVDDPAGTAVVTAPLRVRGWCQERGGGLVIPVEFRVDGAIVAPERIVRTARPDVAAAIPEVGDTSRAGYEAYFGIDAIPPGEHLLEVVFETADRRRVYPPRRFTLVAVRSPGSAPR
ncbi:MAG: hypothetical protein IPN03_06125 [Holophagales bacterium]|nr:hypothetical protein [Holophagales bacterium]